MQLTLSENNKFLVITSCTELEYDQLKASLTKRIDGWRFNPLVKRGVWDGKISFVKKNLIPAGLWKEVADICKEYDFQLTMVGITRIFNDTIKVDEFEAWALKFFEGREITPRDYQIDAAFKILKYKRCLAELATSAGKTLISFMVIGYLMEVLGKKKILMIVPNVSLVIQATGDFEQYNAGKLSIKTQQIYSGAEIRKSSNIVVGTYQSLVNYDEEYFSQFDAVLVDECLHPNTMISMANNTFKKISDVVPGDMVKTINDITGSLETNEVDFVHHNLSRDNQMYEIELEDTTIKITGNHKVKLVSGEYKRVDELTLTDEIISIKDMS